MVASKSALVAFIFTAMATAWMISAAAGGWIIEETRGYEAVMFTTMGLYLVAASLFWWFFRGRVVGEAAAGSSPAAA